MLAGTLGALLTTWVTFVPCFLWIFLGAPYVESLRGHRTLDAALSAITAAIVGVVLNLAVWFSLHALFASLTELRGPLGLRLLVPRWSGLDPWVLCIAAGSLIAVLRFRVGMLPVLGGAAPAGLLLQGLGVV